MIGRRAPLVHPCFGRGNAAQGRVHLRSCDCAIRCCRASCFERFNSATTYRSGSLSPLAFDVLCRVLGYPEAALVNFRILALKNAREIGQATTLLFALCFAPLINIYCGNYATAATELHEAVALADDKGIQFLKAIGMSNRGVVLALTGKASDAVEVLISGITAMRSMGSTFLRSLHLSSLATAYVELNNYEDAWRCISEAMIAVETNKERWCEADIHRIAGQIAAAFASEPDAAKAEAHFARALAVARQQQAKSWELRAALSMARLWRRWQLVEAHKLSLRCTAGSPRGSTRSI